MSNLKKIKLAVVGLVSVLSIIFVTDAGFAQNIDKNLFKEMKWRCIGPANFSGRIVDVEALDSDFRHVIVASASGGVWKSINAGTTWEPIFDHYGSASIGDIAIFQKNPNIIWVGTGEANNRNSVAWGDGIYKSSDGGKTFENMGLKSTYQIARVITHPTDKDVVYVAAVGNLWGFSGDRGLFKTTDGGITWTKLTNGLPNDGKTGATDLVMDPSDPNTLYVAFYQRLRKPYRFDSGGRNGGIFKTTDGGRAWIKLAKGLPEGDTGRIGLAIYKKNPKIIMAIIEHGFQPKMYQEDYQNMALLGTGIYRSEDGGESWTFMNRYNNRPFYYSQIRINPLDDKRVYVLTTTIRLSEDGGKTFRRGELEFEGGLDFHAMWLDPNNKDRYYLGKDKGLTLTHDHGQTFVFFDNMPIGQFYAIGVDMRDPYYVYGGTQDNGTWGGPSFSKDVRGILTDSWWKLHWGDGMFVQIDPTDWRKVYTEAENGSFRRYNAETRRVEFTRPSPKNIVNYHEYITEETESSTNRLPQQFRFNWRAPLVMSSHNPQTLYLGGNFLFKSNDGGYHWHIISPDLSTNDSVKTKRRTGGLTPDTTGAETHCSITTISESPLNPLLIWVGTDDGNVQITRNGGVTWTNVRENIPGVPEGIWVSCVEASHFEEGTCYLTFDGHRSDNFAVWIFKSTDYGKTWTKITNNIPSGQSMYVVREDLRNKNLLFAGSEFACFVSMNGGKTWTRFMNNMPTVAFHDLVIHPRDGDLIAGTHGRSLWILDDITPLQQLTDEILDSKAHIFENRPMTIWEDATRGGVRGHMFFAGENPPYIPKRENIVRAKLISGGLINYYLKSKPQKDVLMEITDITGKHRSRFTVSSEPGINRALWNLRFDPTPEQRQQFIERMEKAFDKL
ncbi:MAG: WD40/YVTN/BNR-like repeat-containing protein, partial [bacterium]